MGRIASVLAFVRGERNGKKVSDVKADLGGGDIVLAEHFASAGDDSHPLATDYALTVPLIRSGGRAVLGYIDPINEPRAQAGDKRIIGRDPSTGAVVVEVWLKNSGEVTVENANCQFTAKPDGAIEGANASGYFKLESGGSFVVNSVVIDPAGNITTPETLAAKVVDAGTSLLAATKELVGHTHLAGTPPGSTGPNE